MERIPPILESDNKEIILDEYIFYSNDGKRGCMGEIGRIAITQKRKWTFDN
ncbi:7373_t:CDS:1, partial [Rhizophagus irregularis]